jgi:hypothetical protein
VGLRGPEYAAAVTHNTARTADRTLDLRMMIHFRLDEGKLAEVWECPDDIDAFVRFWGAQQRSVRAGIQELDVAERRVVRRNDITAQEPPMASGGKGSDPH